MLNLCVIKFNDIFFENHINLGEVKMKLKPTLLYTIFAIFVQTSIVVAQDVQTGSFKITSNSEAILGKDSQCPRITSSSGHSKEQEGRYGRPKLRAA